MSSKLTIHRGLATWGEKLVPLSAFREAAARKGQNLPHEERESAVHAYTAGLDDPTPVEGPFSRIAVFGGVYSTPRPLLELLEAPPRLGAEAVYCLGDLGAF